MKKQIIYPKFITRVFATTLDLAILSLTLGPIITIISRYVFIYIFYQFFKDFNIDIFDNYALAKASRMVELQQYINTVNFLTYILITFLINTLFLAIYFIGFWYKFGSTPGKLFMRMRIVDADTYEAPILKNLIKRFFGYISAFVGIWSIVTNNRGRALHDKFANTVVIKK